MLAGDHRPAHGRASDRELPSRAAGHARECVRTLHAPVRHVSWSRTTRRGRSTRQRRDVASVPYVQCASRPRARHPIDRHDRVRVRTDVIVAPSSCCDWADADVNWSAHTASAASSEKLPAKTASGFTLISGCRVDPRDVESNASSCADSRARPTNRVRCRGT